MYFISLICRSSLLSSMEFGVWLSFQTYRYICHLEELTPLYNYVIHWLGIILIMIIVMIIFKALQHQFSLFLYRHHSPSKFFTSFLGILFTLSLSYWRVFTIGISLRVLLSSIYYILAMSQVLGRWILSIYIYFYYSRFYLKGLEVWKYSAGRIKHH